MLRASVSLYSIKIPETVELSWQAVDEKITHTQTFLLRSQIPSWVLNKLQNSDITHRVDINFFIVDNKPSFCWSLDALPEERGKQHKHIAHSKNCPWLDYLNQFKG